MGLSQCILAIHQHTPTLAAHTTISHHRCCEMTIEKVQHTLIIRAWL